jgi:NAD+ synthase (glutamine-hydrolysing)
MRIALAQLNPTVGDVAGNARLVIDAVDRARRDGADLVVTPELVLVGYPPRDLLLRSGVLEACERAVEAIARRAGGLTVLVGSPRRADDGVRGARNSVFVCRDGAVLDVYDKRRGGDTLANPHYAGDPLAALGCGSCRALVSLNASPFVLGKDARHVELLREAARKLGAPIIAVNQVGANDDLVFDGRSTAVAADGTTLARLPAWTAAVETIDLDAATPIPPIVRAAEEADLAGALVLAIRDYLGKTSHRDVLVGVSGGIDSALTATLAAAALGPAHVHAVLLPSRYTSAASTEDALALTDRLGVTHVSELSIEPIHAAARATLAAAGTPLEGLADENVQARARGLLLMARANQLGALLLSTGNKSEYAAGYATLYGDMCGALAVLGDVLKTRVYAISRWINANPGALGFDGPPIPERSITRPPTAELRPDQTDQDSLPPYEVLDAIIERAVDRDQSAAQIVAETPHDADLVESIVRLIDRTEYKRHQAAIIPKVSPRAFGRGRPMPIVMRPRMADDASPALAGDDRAAAGG